MITLEDEAIGICEFIAVIPVISDNCWTVLSLIWPSICASNLVYKLSCLSDLRLVARFRVRQLGPIMARYNFLNGYLNKWARTMQKVSKHCSSKVKCWEKVTVSHLWRKTCQFFFPQRWG